MIPVLIAVAPLFMVLIMVLALVVSSPSIIAPVRLLAFVAVLLLNPRMPESLMWTISTLVVLLPAFRISYLVFPVLCAVASYP